MISKADMNRPTGWWQGRKVKTVREIQNGLMVIPAGTVCTVERKYGGLDLRSDPCDKCGVKIRISRVSFSEVELLPEQAVATPGQKHA